MAIPKINRLSVLLDKHPFIVDERINTKGRRLPLLGTGTQYLMNNVENIYPTRMALLLKILKLMDIGKEK
jgi:hypothetical protein